MTNTSVNAGRRRRLFENGYFSQSLRQTQIIILEILSCIPVVIVFAFLDLENTISFSNSLQEASGNVLWTSCDHSTGLLKMGNSGECCTHCGGDDDGKSG
jgi:hypothetical protein